jgi:mRNA-degrading endonuclease toxin of MazEF toxin-antitoxin module
MSFPRRGQLYWAELDMRRPVLVISPDYRNELASDVIVVPCSTTVRLAPTHVVLHRGEGGLDRPSALKCEQLTTLRREDVGRLALGPPLSRRRMAEVERAVLRAIGIALP